MDERVSQLEVQVSDLRVAHAGLRAELENTTHAVRDLNGAVKELTAAMNKAAGRKAAFAMVWTAVGAIAALIVEWFASRR